MAPYVKQGGGGGAPTDISEVYRPDYGHAGAEVFDSGMFDTVCSIGQFPALDSFAAQEFDSCSPRRRRGREVSIYVDESAAACVPMLMKTIGDVVSAKTIVSMM
ncbi:hypothetical protein OsJ_13533 [Oryza sativa Japonica Group]|uniref:Uncharacterized protein n=1 Tax=Oryza sativa subsp. japonica TaxID=39947 RepID=A3AQ70_ORYSJ|nr:hypothetical protein OsJ_13533 [Oryza sativa Japonica Group]